MRPEAAEIGYRGWSGGRGIFEANAQGSAWISGRLPARGRRPRRCRRLAAVSRSDAKRRVQRTTARQLMARRWSEGRLAETGGSGLCRSSRRRRTADSVSPGRQRRDRGSAQRAHGCSAVAFRLSDDVSRRLRLRRGATCCSGGGERQDLHVRRRGTTARHRPRDRQEDLERRCGRDSSVRQARRWSKTAG